MRVTSESESGCNASRCVRPIPRFVYFDLGKVLIDFDHDRAVRQLSDVSGIDPEISREIVFSRLGTEFEKGQLDTPAVCRQFREITGATASNESIFAAISNIFEINAEIIPLVAALRSAGVRLGILSNTCDAHWSWLLNEKYALLDLFPVQALSFRLGSVKPERDIYRRAAELAGCAPGEIFFVDDLEANVNGALSAGLDAVRFAGVAELARQLRQRGLQFNY